MHAQKDFKIVSVNLHRFPYWKAATFYHFPNAPREESASTPNNIAPNSSCYTTKVHLSKVVLVPDVTWTAIRRPCSRVAWVFTVHNLPHTCSLNLHDSHQCVHDYLLVFCNKVYSQWKNSVSSVYSRHDSRKPWYSLAVPSTQWPLFELLPRIFWLQNIPNNQCLSYEKKWIG